jgi:hypothetical protein
VAVTTVVVRASDQAVLLLPSGLPQLEVIDKFWFPDAEAVARASARKHLALPADSPVTPSWTMPRWYADALPWIDEQLDAAGAAQTGPMTQVRSWGLSNVLRCPTAQGDLYFKAVAHSSTIRPARVDALPLLFAH